MSRLSKTILVLLTISAGLQVETAQAAEFSADVGMAVRTDSNIFMNSDDVGDVVFVPHLTLGVDFSRYWTFGYEGSLSAFAGNSDLMSHGHSLYIMANPAWGKDDVNEFFVRLSTDTQRFMAGYSSINVFRPILEAGVTLEPVSWFRWSLYEYVAYSWFYDDSTMDYLDSWSRMSAQFTFQTRTTLTPRIAYGFRRYIRGGQAGSGDRSDNQIEAGLHFSQGLWKDAGLQADYVYAHAFDTSGLISRKSASLEFNYLEETFIFSGHRARIGLKQMFAGSWTIEANLEFETRVYLGWLALDASGVSIGEDRSDMRLGPSIGLQYRWVPSETASTAVPAVKVRADYGYTRQWSNHVQYDADRHSAILGIDLEW